MESVKEVLNFTAADMIAEEGEIKRKGVVFSYAGNGVASIIERLEKAETTFQT